MSEVPSAAVVLLGVGLLGVLFVVAHPRLCAWADWGLMTGPARRRVAVVQRRLSAVAVGSAGLAGLGLLLGLGGVLA